MAFSEEQMMQIYSEVTRLRREFLKDEITRRLTGEEVEVEEEEGFDTAEEYFDSLPHIPYIDRRTNTELGGQVNHWTRENDASAHWNQLMSFYAELAGFRVWSTKYDDYFYTPDRDTEYYRKEVEKRFDSAHARSQWLSSWGFDLDFMMDGIHYVHQAAITLDSLQRALGNFEYFRGGSEVKKFFPAPYGYWQPLIERVAQMHLSAGSYLGVVSEIEEGVYHAPYFHPTMRADGDFFNMDDVNRACFALGVNDKLRHRMWGFMLQYALTEEGFEDVARRMYRGGVPTREPGVIFMDKDLLMVIDEELQESRKKTKIGVSAREVLRLLKEDEIYEIDYEHLAFNR